jgi:hypothetical protein
MSESSTLHRALLALERIERDLGRFVVEIDACTSKFDREFVDQHEMGMRLLVDVFTRAEWLKRDAALARYQLDI